MAKKIQSELINDFVSENDFRLNDSSCDTEVHVGEETFKCHRSVLSSSSDYFNTMFSGNFSERFSGKVVLEELEAPVFQVMLKFMYTKEADIGKSNLFDIIRASDFYQMVHLMDRCIVYMRQNLNEIADVILKIFWYAHRMSMKDKVAFLKPHIYQNFGYFSNLPDFVELSVDSLLDILAVVYEECVIPLQDVFLEGVYIWITRQENLNADERKSYSDRLLEKIDLTQLSDEYTEKRLPECMAVLQSPDGSIDSSIQPPNVVQRCPKLLRVYVSTISKDLLSLGTRVFTGFSNAGPSAWENSPGEVKESFSYSEGLRKKIYLKQSSEPYSMAVLRRLDGNIHACSIHASYNMINACSHLLRAYVPIISEDDVSFIKNRSSVEDLSFMKNSVIKGFSDPRSKTWVYSGEVKNCFASYMDSTVVNDLLYSLSYSGGGPRGAPSQQTFRYSSSASMYPYVSLSLPPLVCEFDMCGIANQICLYNKRSHSGPNLFLYKRDIDKWFPLPPPKVNVNLASLTCDDERLYLIGGSTDRHLRSGSRLVQAYDVRTSEWSELPPMKCKYLCATSCIYEKKIFVVSRGWTTEIYDPASGNSRSFISYDKPVIDRPKLLNWSDKLVIYGRHSFETSCYTSALFSLYSGFSNFLSCSPWNSLPDTEYGFLNMIYF